MPLYSISAHIESNRTRAGTSLLHWTGKAWTARMDDAARFYSLPVVKKIARALANEWHTAIGVNEVAEPLAGRAPSGELAKNKRRAKQERRTAKRSGADRRTNPVPLSRHASLKASRERFKEFRGDNPGGISPVKVTIPKSAMTVGELDGVLYTTVRDGKTEKYQHKFRKKSRPLLTASDDGKQLIIVGGQYKFTERGIVDD